jgi:hypothetical protein
MPREQPQQLLARISGGAGHGDARRRNAAALRVSAFALTGLNCRMHQKEYLYSVLSAGSTKIDEYS